MIADSTQHGISQALSAAGGDGGTACLEQLNFEFSRSSGGAPYTGYLLVGIERCSSMACVSNEGWPEPLGTRVAELLPALESVVKSCTIRLSSVS